MYIKTMTYVDYDGNERTEDFCFNISKGELARLNLSIEGGLENKIKTMVSKMNGPEIGEFFEKVILMSYGEKSPDGKRFIKSEELSKAFSQTEAYSDMFFNFTTNAQEAADFINKILPTIPEATRPVLHD